MAVTSNHCTSIFNSILLSNFIIISSSGLSFHSAINGSPIRLTASSIIAISSFGVILCIAWRPLIARKHKLSQYYTLCARSLEERYLSDTIDTISRGGVWLRNNTIPRLKENGGKIALDPEKAEIHFHFHDHGLIHRIPWYGKFKAEKVSYFVIWCFLILYIFAFSVGVFLFVKGSEQNLRTKQEFEKAISELEKRIEHNEQLIIGLSRDTEPGNSK